MLPIIFFNIKIYRNVKPHDNIKKNSQLHENYLHFQWNQWSWKSSSIYLGLNQFNSCVPKMFGFIQHPFQAFFDLLYTFNVWLVLNTWPIKPQYMLTFAIILHIWWITILVYIYILLKANSFKVMLVILDSDHFKRVLLKICFKLPLGQISDPTYLFQFWLFTLYSFYTSLIQSFYLWQIVIA